ncbi:hypothetical protein [Burkholderia sp. BC1]|uniref:hypothetical protein n=1 Tax=Burkholderia sp. BC1 TaxID=1095370 RepID=UPI0040447F1C
MSRVQDEKNREKDGERTDELQTDVTACREEGAQQQRARARLKDNVTERFHVKHSALLFLDNKLGDSLGAPLDHPRLIRPERQVVLRGIAENEQMVPLHQSEVLHGTSQLPSKQAADIARRKIHAAA